MKRDSETQKQLEEYELYLEREEKSPATCEKYLRDVQGFLNYLAKGHTDSEPWEAEGITEEDVLAYKQHLVDDGCRTSTINCCLSAMRSFFIFLGRSDIHVKNMKCQRSPYLSQKKLLKKSEYRKLTEKAIKLGNRKLDLILESICSTGIRVSELQYITVEAARKGEAEVILKGKTRRILMPVRLRDKLLRFASEEGIEEGPIFLNGKKQPLHRSYVWQMMKNLAVKAEVDPSRVYPHNLRRLFARSFYQGRNDIAKLADVLGHSSIDTTRLYIATTADEHIRILDELDLVT